MLIKLLSLFALVLLAMIVLLFRIAHINVSSGKQYAKQVLSQKNYDSQTLSSRRGEIKDANGRLLAYSEKQYHVVLDCHEVNLHETDNDGKDYEEYVDATVGALADVFGLDKSELRDIIQDEKTRDSQYQVVARYVTEDQKDAFEEYISLDESRKLSDEEKKRLRRVTGIWFEEHFVRRYPMDRLASNVIGFANLLGDGICGLESYYDDMLQGTDGRVFGYLNESQEYQRRTIAPQNGYTLQTTLDINIQQIVEKYIAAFDEQYGTDEDDGTAKHGAKNIGVVVMDPNSGAVLAMASNRSFDLNDPYDLSDWYTTSEQKSMPEDDYVKALNQLWSNFCVTDGYEPGSTVKPINMAAALEMGAVSTGTDFYCDGYEFVTDTRINCDNVSGHGAETLEQVLQNSCNDGLMAIGRAMGVSRYIENQSLFNFGQRTGIDLPNESTGVVYTKERMNEVELATCSFGQGFTCTMVQEIAAFCSVVNGGYYYQPHVVDKILNSSGQVIRSMDDLVLKQTISSEVSDIMKGYLENAVQHGTGQKSQVPGYRTGGKTGTAEKINPETGTRWKGHYLVSFIGAAPINDPEVVIYVVVDEPNVDNQAVSAYAQVLFQEIGLELFPYLNIYPTEDVTDELLVKLGLSRADLAGTEAKASFQAMDSYGNFYNGAWINDENIVVTADGTPIAGAYIDTDGTVYDGQANPVWQVEAAEVYAEEKAENPDMAAPPQEAQGDPEDASLWDPSVLSEDEE